jgi:predicted DNA-binding transcriptional regulator YafY
MRVGRNLSNPSAILDASGVGCNSGVVAQPWDCWRDQDVFCGGGKFSQAASHASHRRQKHNTMVQDIVAESNGTRPGLCSSRGVDYAQVLVQCYFQRTQTEMTEASPLVRQWILLRTLCTRRQGATIKELSAEMGVGEKTIRRDLEAFQTAGFPLTETVGQFGRKSWRIDPNNHQPGMSFAYDEAIALYLGRRLLEPLAGTVFWEAAQRAFKKIRATLGKDALKYVDRFATMFHQTMVGVSDYSQKADLIDTLMQGIEDRRAVFITYQSLRATEPVTYDIYPYGLTYHRGSLYLVGRAPQYDAIRHWKVDRIEEARLEELRFNRPEDFDLCDHFAKSFGVFHDDGEAHVKVRFSPTVARYVQESKWHASQTITKEKDGSVLAEFDLGNTEEIMRWILSFGRHTQVVEPVSLANVILDEVVAMSQTYSANLKRSGRRASAAIQE